MVLDRLRMADLKLKPEKCALFQKSVSFLGHVISEDDVATDPANVQAVADWPVPSCFVLSLVWRDIINVS